MGIFSKDRRYFNKASGYLKKGDFQKAIKYLDKALEINHNYAVAWNEKGFAFSCMGLFNEALECYDKSLEIRPNFSPALLNKAKLLLYEFDNYDEAIKYHNIFLNMDKEVLNKEIKGFNEYSEILLDVSNDKGLALFNIGKYKEAIICYNESLKIDPNNETALNGKELAENELNNLSIECPSCGAKNLDTTDFCQKCGKGLNQINENLLCTNCNAQIGSEMRFCPSCGHVIEEIPKEIVCPNCNFIIDNEVNFCPECGENLEIKKETVLIDINNDSEEKIASVPGIGPILAKKAVKIRESKGGFSSVADFRISLELKPHVVSRVEDYIICNPVTSEKPKFSGRVVDW